MPQPQEFLELEVKLAVDAETKPPKLSLIDATLSPISTTTHELSAIYFDTADLRLTRSKITLRRRTGGKDAGWHVKLPGESGGRRELQHPLSDGTGSGNGVGSDADTVPEPLLDAVRDVLGPVHPPLKPIARVDNRRVETVIGVRYPDPADSLAVAEFCDDHVSAESYLPGGTASEWREWELELTDAIAGTPAGERLLSRATEAMLAAGARRADSPSKLATALGDSFNNAPLPSAGTGDAAADAVYASLRDKRDAILSWEPRVRADEYDSVHQMRVATRELRSLLETFDGVITAGDLAHLEAELKHAAAVLGMARDAEVVEQRFHDLLASDQSDMIDVITAAHINRDMRGVYEEAHADIVDMFDSERFTALLGEVDALLHDAHTPHLPGEVDEDEGGADKQEPEEPADAVLYAHLRAAYKKLKKRNAKVEKYYGDTSLPLLQRESYVHDVRKTAKKLRYAAVAAKDAGLKTGPLAKACKRLQTILGDFQDAVTAREHIERLARAARDRGEDTFAYGILYQRELEIGRAALEDYPKAIKDIKKAFKQV